MLTSKMFGEIITAMVTPFDFHGGVNHSEAERIAYHLIETGTDTLLLVGTTGESPTLTHDEEYSFFKHMTQVFKGKVKIMAGTGSNCTHTAIEMTKKVVGLGVDGILQVVPYYNKPSQEGIYQHFKAVSDASDVPVLLYNIPGRSGVNMAAQTVSRLSVHPQIIGIKEASGSVEQVKEIRSLCRDDFLIYSGDDALTLSFMKEGAVGVVSVASHLVGSRIQKMIHAYRDGNVSVAEEESSFLAPLFDVLFITSNPSPIKAALDMVGFQTGGVRLPLVSVTEEESLMIREVLTRLSII